jgi:uncharacterized phage-like protein YoqJ
VSELTIKPLPKGSIVAGTGHRLSKLGGYAPWAHELLVELLKEILAVLKPAKVISGMALGFDQALARAALELGIPLIAAIPNKSQPSQWPAESQQVYRDLIAQAERVVDISGGNAYADWQMQARNVHMVDSCNLLLALWGGSPGGTANCVTYAKRKGKRTLNVYALWKERYDNACRERGLDETASRPASTPHGARTTIPAGDGSIIVVRKGDPSTAGAVRVYIGRGSPLGNPYSHMHGTTAQHVVSTRDEAVKAYERYLKDRLAAGDEAIRQALNTIALPAKSGKQVELECYCAPHACHGDVVAQLVAERLAAQRPIPRDTRTTVANATQ